MQNLYIKLMKADIKKEIYGYTKLSNRTDLKCQSLNNLTSLEISGSVKDLIQGFDFIELGGRGEPHYIDKIRIKITLGKDTKFKGYSRAFYIGNSYDECSTYYDERELYIGDIYLDEQQFNHLDQLLNDQFSRISFSFSKNLSQSAIDKKTEDELFTESDRLDKLDITYNENKKILFINSKEMLIESFNISSSKPKFIEKNEWLDNVESLIQREELLKEKSEYEKIYLEEKKANQMLLSSNKKKSVNLKSIYQLLLGIAILLAIMVFKS